MTPTDQHIDDQTKAPQTEPRRKRKSTNTGEKRLANGAIYSYDVGRIVANPGGGTHAITSETARDMQMLGLLKKRAVMHHAANRDVPPELLSEYGEMAHIAERAINLQRMASSPEAGKAAVMAHNALTADQGFAEPRVSQAQVQVQTPVQADDDILMLVMRRRLLAGDVVDGVVRDAGASQTGAAVADEQDDE